MACSHISATAVPKTFGCSGDEHLLGDCKPHKPPVQETTLDTVQAQGPAGLKSLLPGCGGKPQGAIKLLWLTISPVVLTICPVQKTPFKTSPKFTTNTFTGDLALASTTPALTGLTLLSRLVPPSSLTASCGSLPKLCSQWKRTSSLMRDSQGYMNICATLLELANKFPNKFIDVLRN